jgi:biopolymer transport protein ExbD
MNSILLYILKSTVCISALYLIFRLFMRKESSFTVNRAIILTIVAASLIIPLLHMPQLIQTPIEVKLIPDFSENTIQIQNQPIIESAEPINFQLPDDTPAQQKKLTIPLETLLLYIYLAGVFISLVLLIRNIVIVLKLFRIATVIQKDGYRLLIVDREVPSFAFNRSVVISQNDFDSHGPSIMAHEQAHIRLKHFNDLIFLEAVKIFHWFNPFIYWLIHDLKDIHEFQADDQTLTKGIDATKYQLLIIQKGVGPKRFALANCFNHCQIKKRIVMMNKLKTSKAWRWKVAIFLPMLALLLMAFGKKGENAPPEKETLPSVVSLPQDPVKQWTEADFQELTKQNMRALFDKAKDNSQLNWINIHIDQKSNITVNTGFNIWKSMNLDEIHSLIAKSWTYSEKRKKIFPIPLVLISKDSASFPADYLKLLNVAANSILQARDDYSKKLYGLSYPKLTTTQHNEIDKLIPMNVVYSKGKPEKVPAPPPLPNQKGQTSQADILYQIPPPPPPIFIDIKKDSIFLMKNLVTLDEFRKQLPGVVKKNPTSQVWVNIIDKSSSNIEPVDKILKEAGISSVKYRQTIKFTPPKITPPPPIFIDIKKEGIYLMKKLVTLDEFRKQLPEVVKKNPQSEAMISSDDKNNSNIKAVENILQEEGVSIVKYRNTIKFTPPVIKPKENNNKEIINQGPDKITSYFGMGRQYYIEGQKYSSKYDSLYKLQKTENIPFRDSTTLRNAMRLNFQKADSAFTKVTQLDSTFYGGYLWKGRMQSRLDPESETNIGKAAYKKALAILEKGDVEKNKKSMIECYKYLAFNSFVNYERLNKTEKQQAEELKKATMDYFLKILQLDPADKQAKESVDALKLTNKLN